MSPRSASVASSPSFELWLAEGLAHLAQLKHAVALAPSATLSANISTRFAALSGIATQHLVLLNACTSPLVRLPREIQQHIFSDVAEDEHLRKWIGLGQICSALRNALLDHRCVWGDAIYSWPDGRHRDKLLERAGPSAPLRLSILANKGAPDAAQFAMQHLYRARNIHASDLSFIQSFVQNTDSPLLPYLEKVKLIPDEMEESPIIALEKPPRNTPRLREVQMNNVFWSFSVPTLASLSISSTPVHTATHLFDVLRQTKCMRDLHLFRCLPFLPDDLAPAGTLSYPYMEALYVADRRDYALQLWRLFSLPTDAEVTFSLFCEDDEDSDDKDSDDEDFLHSLFAGPPRIQDLALFKHHFGGRRPIKLEVGNADGPYFSVRAHSDGVERVKLYVRPGQRSTLFVEYLSFCNHHTPAADLRFLERVALLQACDALGLSSITHFSHSGSFGAGHWLAMLGIFGQLEHLEVQVFSISLCAALCLQDPDPRAVRRPVLLPQLRQLTIGSANLREDVDVLQTQLTTKEFFNLMELRAGPDQSLHMVGFKVLQVGTGSGQEKQAFLDRLRSQFPDCHVSSS